MDEPLSNLDAKLRVQARTEISKLHQPGHHLYLRHPRPGGSHDHGHPHRHFGRVGFCSRWILPKPSITILKNKFVAGFIGSPAMNFFEGRLVPEGETVVFQGEGLTLALPTSMQQLGQRHGDNLVTLGIRPEDIHDPAYLPPGIEPMAVAATVVVVEHMGNELILHCQTQGGQSLSARVDRRSQMRRGETVNLSFDLGACHLFDAATEVALV
jgi:multiple sugar transport system ATP-binding protein